MNICTPINSTRWISASVHVQTATFFAFTRSHPPHTFKRYEKGLSTRLHAFLTSLVCLGSGNAGTQGQTGTSTLKTTSGQASEGISNHYKK